jgi:hypothetical protein
MATTKYIGTGEVTSADFKNVKWVGKTKDGKAVTIELTDAMNMSNIDWTIQEKNDIVPSVEFQACYTNTDNASASNTEPWSIEIDSSLTSGANEIVLGAGVFYIGGTAVALTRGGGSFTVEREYREINADGDRGAVKNRVVMESSRAKLTMNLLTFLTRLTDIYPSIAASV